MILGPTAISEKKLLSGMPLDILGITVRIAPEGLHFFPTEDKVEKWKRTIASALQKGVLHGGEAQKLAGGLPWAGQKAFRRLGRAMLRPIIMQQWCVSPFIALAMQLLAAIAARSQTAEIGEELRLALQWFLEVLAEELDEVRGWTRKRKAPLHLYCDARGEPARIAAVLFKCACLLASKQNPPLFVHLPAGMEKCSHVTCHRPRSCCSPGNLGVRTR